MDPPYKAVVPLLIAAPLVAAAIPRPELRLFRLLPASTR
jgi:hypothetical protein